MKSLAIVSALALIAAAPQAALAQADFLTAKKIACTPVQTLECADGKCKATPVSEKDKAEVLVVDFTTKKSAVRTAGVSKDFGEIGEDKVEGSVRTFQLGESKDSMIKVTLDKAGKLTLFMGTEGKQELRAEATCVVEP